MGECFYLVLKVYVQYATQPNPFLGTSSPSPSEIFQRPKVKKKEQTSRDVKKSSLVFTRS